jgi:uncharacterized protein YbjT (DUF2867 family)
MRLLILGASGGCGQWLTRLAAERDHHVTALVRPESRFVPPPGVVVREGDITDPSFLSSVLAGQDAVLSCLGLRRAGRSPWAPLLSPPDLTSRVTKLLISAMGQRGVKRLVVISAAGVGDSIAQLTWPVRRLVATGNVGVAYRDLAAMEDMLAASGLDWLVVRPVTLSNGLPRGNARVVERYTMVSTIRRADVAAWMLAAAERPEAFTERRVMLGA